MEHTRAFRLTDCRFWHHHSRELMPKIANAAMGRRRGTWRVSTAVNDRIAFDSIHRDPRRDPRAVVFPPHYSNHRERPRPSPARWLTSSTLPLFLSGASPEEGAVPRVHQRVRGARREGHGSQADGSRASPGTRAAQGDRAAHVHAPQVRRLRPQGAISPPRDRPLPCQICPHSQFSRRRPSPTFPDLPDPTPRCFAGTATLKSP